MRRLVLAVTTSAILMVATAGAAAAGAPGTNFPEQANGGNACAKVLSNPGTGSLGAAGAHESSTAAGIIGLLVVDACFGGP